YRLLAQVVVDAEDLILAEHFADLTIELARGAQIGAERLLHDHARPAPTGIAAGLAAGRQAGHPELLDDLRIEDRRDSEVEEPVSRGPAVAIDPLQARGQLLVRGGLVELAAVVLDPLAE